MNYYKCGKIMTTHGIKGDLKIQPSTDFDRFKKGSRLYILHQNQYVEVIVSEVKPFGKYLLVNFENLKDINLVEKYHLNEIYVSEEDRDDDLLDDEFYYKDLIGLPVFNEQNEERGIVKEIKSLPQCDYLYVLYQGKYYYIPFLNEFVLEITDRIIIHEIEGLML